jgi:hypothetical protein
VGNGCDCEGGIILNVVAAGACGLAVAGATGAGNCNVDMVGGGGEIADADAGDSGLRGSGGLPAKFAAWTTIARGASTTIGRGREASAVTAGFIKGGIDSVADRPAVRLATANSCRRADATKTDSFAVAESPTAA